MNSMLRLKTLKGRDHSKDLGVDGEIMDLREIGWEGVDWMQLAQNRGQ
jgi:hypothetical protein